MRSSRSRWLLSSSQARVGCYWPSRPGLARCLAPSMLLLPDRHHAGNPWARSGDTPVKCQAPGG
jgi:hypothetical protein